MLLSARRKRLTIRGKMFGYANGNLCIQTPELEAVFSRLTGSSHSLLPLSDKPRHQNQTAADFTI
jgi:hypothetical protein